MKIHWPELSYLEQKSIWWKWGENISTPTKLALTMRSSGTRLGTIRTCSWLCLEQISESLFLSLKCDLVCFRLVFGFGASWFFCTWFFLFLLLVSVVNSTSIFQDSFSRIRVMLVRNKTALPQEVHVTYPNIKCYQELDVTPIQIFHIKLQLK